MISEVIKKAKQDNIPGVVDFGAGHSVYDDNEIFEILDKVLPGYNKKRHSLQEKEDRKTH